MENTLMLPKTSSSHLDISARVNLDAYYTGEKYVDIVWQLVKPHLRLHSVVLDSSCGSGNFFRSQEPYRQVGNDIDSSAIAVARLKPWVECHHRTALFQANRTQFGVDDNAPLCIIGNPPYNDRTSIIRHHLRHAGAIVDENISTRDLGMSFLLSYQKLNADCVCKLNADCVCVLYPLSHLIKPSNFRSIRQFLCTYRLERGIIVSNGVFEQASKTNHFPIVIAVYRKSAKPMEYFEILKFRFEVAGGPPFSLSSFDTIANYVGKYPARNCNTEANDVFFWTLRDFNALKRNRTFMEHYSKNIIIINPRQLEYYAYIDVIRRFADHNPYYFGSCDVLIDNDRFQMRKHYSVTDTINHNPYLAHHFPLSEQCVNINEHDMRSEIRAYLRELLGEHYIPH